MKVKTCTACKEFVRISESYEGQLKVNKFTRRHACHPIVILDERDLGPLYHSVDSEFNKKVVVQRKEDQSCTDYVNLWKAEPEGTQP